MGMRRLLLDFGGVVIKTPFENRHRVGSPDWFGPFDPENDSVWTAMQAGEITEREHWRRRTAEVFPESDDPIRDAMALIFAPPADEVRRSEITELLADVERPAVLTNDLARFHDDSWLEAMGLADTFDPLIDLSYVGYLKPSPEAYAHAVKVLGEDPDDIVFVDDQPGNVQGARDYGLRAVWFDVTDPAGSVRRTREALR